MRHDWKCCYDVENRGVLFEEAGEPVAPQKNIFLSVQKSNVTKYALKKWIKDINQILVSAIFIYLFIQINVSLYSSNKYNQYNYELNYYTHTHTQLNAVLTFY